MPAPLPHDDTQIDCSKNGSILAGTLHEQIAQLDVAQASGKLGINVNDSIVISDSEMNDMVKKVGWANFLSILKQSFDQYYNNYSHPTGDGSMHVPATSTSHNRHVLMGGPTPGSAAWTEIDLVRWRGIWSSGTEYVKNDCVSYGGSTFRAISTYPFTNVTPAEGTYWTVLAGKGTDGNPGTPGAPGADGSCIVDGGVVSGTLNDTYGTFGLYKTSEIYQAFNQTFDSIPKVTIVAAAHGNYAANPCSATVNEEKTTTSGFYYMIIGLVNGATAYATWTAALPGASSGGGSTVSVGPTVVSLKNLGAADDDDISTLFNNHYSSGSTICIDGRFLVSSPLVVYGRPCVFGFGNNSILYANSNIPIFNCNLNSTMDHPDFHKFCLQNRAGGDSAHGFKFYGTTSGIWMGHGRWEHLSFEGTHTGFYFDKVVAAGTEAGFDWNYFEGMDFTNYGSIAAQFGFHFMGGSGTGNQFRGIISVVQNCAMAWEANDGANIGDILIDGLHCGGAGKGIFMPNRPTSYKARVSFDNVQFDAGLEYGFYIESGYTGVSIGTYNKGGGIIDVLPSGVHNLYPTNY